VKPAEFLKLIEGWIGVDFDGTLAEYDEWRGPEHVGKPIQKMLDRVKGWLEAGKDVRILTGRVGADSKEDVEASRKAIRDWCIEYVGKELPITNEKDPMMDELWDDKVVQVKKNTGEPVGDLEETAPMSREDLLRRGSCCGMGCRNCPYTPRHKKGSRQISKTG
jgi:hypothetical protein